MSAAIRVAVASACSAFVRTARFAFSVRDGFAIAKRAGLFVRNGTEMKRGVLEPEPEPGVIIRILELPNVFLAHTGYCPIQLGLLGAVSPAGRRSPQARVGHAS